MSTSVSNRRGESVPNLSRPVINSISLVIGYYQKTGKPEPRYNAPDDYLTNRRTGFCQNPRLHQVSLTELGNCNSPQDTNYS